MVKSLDYWEVREDELTPDFREWSFVVMLSGTGMGEWPEGG